MLERPQAEFVVYRYGLGELDWMHKSTWDKNKFSRQFDVVFITTSVRDAINLTMLANQQNKLENNDD